MRRRISLLLMLLLPLPAAAAEVIRAGRWEFHNSFWMGLHQTLMHDASARKPRDLSTLTPAQLATWNAAVATYKANAGQGSITFAEPMMAVQNALTQAADDAVSVPVAGALGDALRQAAPAYRAHWWPADHAANRFFIGYTSAMVRDAGEELAAAHEAVYGERLPKTIRVDITPFAIPFGAYTHTLADGGLTVTISSREQGNHGLTGLETVLHESSHGLVGPRWGSLGTAIQKISKARGIAPPRDLWHAILFATTSELTRRALAARGASGYIPMSEDLLTRAWPQYRKAIETHWYPYLTGRGTLEAAVESVIAATQ
ncbi:MAG TPA: hypothetical protein VFL80_06830 [Thermoanaerobaculia bacterium]|nr:hypothetical protein [Thermoanaerobaculia bacterium]